MQREQHPADITVVGDPKVDPEISLNVHTPIRKYNINLQRLNSSILHEDFKVLHVFTDSDGKTVFHEDNKHHRLHQKADKLHFYHDVGSGTLVSLRHNDNHNGGNMKHFVEGIIHEEMVIAPPLAHKRHKRSLHLDTHTIWRKSPDSHTFSDDELFVPPSVDNLKFPWKELLNLTTLNSTASKSVEFVNVFQKRQKRQVTLSSSKIEPELLLFCDNAMVQQFEGDTDELLEYLLHFWHAVNWKFLTISLQRKWPHIDLKIREIGVFRDATAQPFIEENRIRQGSRLFSLYDAMDSLQRWLVKYETVLPLHDVAFLQTGNDACRMTSHTRRFKDSRFTSDDDEEEVDGCVAGTAGVAYVRGACLSAPYFRKLAYNFGIGEASTSFNGVIIAAHEVGHLLGAYHDGEAEASPCASNSGFIMSYSREDAFKFSRFSDCSIQSFQNFLNMDRSGCLKQRASNEIMQFPTSFPGTYMSITEQCRRFTGGPPCEVGPKQCEHLCCDDAKGQWRYTRSEPAVDGSSCGARNVCLNGQCISLTSFG
ncbi:A disintegrin and metalloproteinase with thrombospondin motifs 2-like [Dreissena polymorpha]|nr:A disintegrin and metalloproteinase with thrombospondin motifs 2-like [Dreissena polymorpha]